MPDDNDLGDEWEEWQPSQGEAKHEVPNARDESVRERVANIADKFRTGTSDFVGVVEPRGREVVKEIRKSAGEKDRGISGRKSTYAANTAALVASVLQVAANPLVAVFGSMVSLNNMHLIRLLATGEHQFNYRLDKVVSPGSFISTQSEKSDGASKYGVMKFEADDVQLLRDAGFEEGEIIGMVKGSIIAHARSGEGKESKVGVDRGDLAILKDLNLNEAGRQAFVKEVIKASQEGFLDEEAASTFKKENIAQFGIRAERRVVYKASKDSTESEVESLQFLEVTTETLGEGGISRETIKQMLSVDRNDGSRVVFVDTDLNKEVFTREKHVYKKGEKLEHKFLEITKDTLETVGVKDSMGLSDTWQRFAPTNRSAGIPQKLANTLRNYRDGTREALVANASMIFKVGGGAMVAALVAGVSSGDVAEKVWDVMKSSGSAFKDNGALIAKTALALNTMIYFATKKTVNAPDLGKTFGSLFHEDDGIKSGYQHGRS